jgi:hypothetical protein
MMPLSLIVGCSSDGSKTALTESAPDAATPIATEQAKPSVSAGLSTPTTVSSTTQIPSTAYEIGPLAPNQTPRLDLIAIDNMLRSGALGDFFTTGKDVDDASITLGLITDHSHTSIPTAYDPTFIGYVVSGGHSTCVPSGPPRSDGSFPPNFPCHAFAIIDADNGQIPVSGSSSDAP